MLQVPDAPTQKLLALADFIENLPPEKFDMKHWGVWSEPRCLCGWFLHNEGHFQKDDWREAGRRLGLDEETAGRLFSGGNDWTPGRAARVLRHLATTGELSGVV